MQLKLKPKYAGSVATLQFRNPTDSFSTRCDVVYKTLLRDCRRYFYDCFQMKTMRKNKRVYHLSKTLAVFVDKKFDSPNFTEEFRRQIEFCLGCLVYPKEMTNSKVAIYGEEGQVIKGQERAKKLRKVKELHSYLYSFSMDKCEKFFKNPYLSAIFEEYLKSFTERATQIETIRKNYEIYQAAVGLIRNLLEYYKIKPIDSRYGTGKEFMKKELEQEMGKSKIKANRKQWMKLIGTGEGLSDTERVVQAYLKREGEFRKLAGKGIPNEYRWDVWMALMDVKDIFSKQKYDSLLEEIEDVDEETDPIMRQIIVDVNRSFTWHPYFDKNVSKEGLNKLKRCLKAYSAYNSQIGYTQGMNYVMGFLLMISGGREVETFWLFVALTEGQSETFTPGIEKLYTEGFPLYFEFEQAFEGMFKENVPELQAHFDELDFKGPIWLQKWFMTMFLYSFPLTYCIRIWDNIFAEGPIFMFKLILSVTSSLQNDLLGKDFTEVNTIISSFNKDTNRNTSQHNPFLPSIETLLTRSNTFTISLPKFSTA